MRLRHNVAAAIDAVATGRLPPDMPPDHGLNYDYLCTFPVGVSILMELQPGADDAHLPDGTLAMIPHSVIAPAPAMTP